MLKSRVSHAVTSLNRNRYSDGDHCIGFPIVIFKNYCNEHVFDYVFLFENLNFKLHLAVKIQEFVSAHSSADHPENRTHFQCSSGSIRSFRRYAFCVLNSRTFFYAFSIIIRLVAFFTYSRD